MKIREKYIFLQKYTGSLKLVRQVLSILEFVEAVYLDFRWKNKILVSCPQITNSKQHKEMIFAEKNEENQAKYCNNIYTVDTCIYMLKMNVLCCGHKENNS